jgi:hypothetical protein
VGFVGHSSLATIAADGVQHVRIEGGGYFFKHNRVIVHVNVPAGLGRTRVAPHCGMPCSMAARVSTEIWQTDIKKLWRLLIAQSTCVVRLHRLRKKHWPILNVE